MLRGVVQVRRKINPQPNRPILSCFRGEIEYGPGWEGWYYQSPESSDGLTYNAPHPFCDPDAPGKIGELFDGEIIERVRVAIKKGVAYWLIDTRPVS